MAKSIYEKSIVRTLDSLIAQVDPEAIGNRRREQFSFNNGKFKTYWRDDDPPYDETEE